MIAGRAAGLRGGAGFQQDLRGEEDFLLSEDAIFGALTSSLILGWGISGQGGAGD